MGHLYLSRTSPVGRLCLQPLHLVGQAVDLLLGPQHVAEVHLVTMEAVVGTGGVAHEGGGSGGAGGAHEDNRRGAGLHLPQLHHCGLGEAQDPSGQPGKPEAPPPNPLHSPWASSRPVHLLKLDGLLQLIS